MFITIRKSVVVTAQLNNNKQSTGEGFFFFIKHFVYEVKTKRPKFLLDFYIEFTQFLPKHSKEMNTFLCWF